MRKWLSNLILPLFADEIKKLVENAALDGVKMAKQLDTEHSAEIYRKGCAYGWGVGYCQGWNDHFLIGLEPDQRHFRIH